MPAVTPNAKGRYPWAAKTQGAGFGAGSGVGLASIIIGATETYGIHGPLPGWASQGISFGCAIAAALFGAWWAPNQDRVPAPPDAAAVRLDAAAAEFRRRWSRNIMRRECSRASRCTRRVSIVRCGMRPPAGTRRGRRLTWAAGQ